MPAYLCNLGKVPLKRARNTTFAKLAVIMPAYFCNLGKVLLNRSEQHDIIGLRNPAANDIESVCMTKASVRPKPAFRKKPFFEHGLELYAGRSTPEGRAFSREKALNPKP